MNMPIARATAGDSRTVLHWYDFLCPFCYVAQSRNDLLEQQGFLVVKLPFQAHPEIPSGGIRAGWRSGTMYTTLEREAEEVGLPLHWPTRLPNTRLALSAAEWTRRYQPMAFRKLHQALFRAHFALGEDLGDLEVIEQYAKAAHIDIDALHTTLANGRAARVVTEAERLRRWYGVQGAPAWLLNRQLITGLLPVSDFEYFAESAYEAAG
jgi:predicted DsbA family dithiol-disulfide isomerase